MSVISEAYIQTIFAQSSSELAHEALHKAVQLLEPKYPAAAAIVEEAEHDVLAYMNFRRSTGCSCTRPIRWRDRIERFVDGQT